MLKVDKKLKLKDDLIEYVQKLRSDTKESALFFDRIRLNIMDTYPDLFIPADSLLVKLIARNQICSIFTFLEDYKVPEPEFYTIFFKEYIKVEKAFPVGLRDFIHLMQIIKKAFETNLLKKRK